VIKNITWQRYRVNFIPNQNYQYLTFGSFNASAIPSDTFHSNIAYLGLDSISDIIVPHYKFVKATITQDTATHCFQLSSIAAYGGLNFQWSSIPSGFSSSAQNPGLVCPVVNTSYIVSFTTPCGSIVYDTVFADMHTGINDLKGNGNKLEVYPNPVSNVLICKCANMLINTIEITDVLGRVCSIPPLQRGLGGLELNISNLTNGIYFIKATDTNGNMMNGKFVKE
jgi:hypothetical protein